MNQNNSKQMKSIYHFTEENQKIADAIGCIDKIMKSTQDVEGLKICCATAAYEISQMYEDVRINYAMSFTALKSILEECLECSLEITISHEQVILELACDNNAVRFSISMHSCSKEILELKNKFNSLLDKYNLVD